MENCTANMQMQALKRRLQFNCQRFSKMAGGAWLNYKTNFRTLQYIRVLTQNLLALALIVSEIWAFIQTHRQADGQTNS